MPEEENYRIPLQTIKEVFMPKRKNILSSMGIGMASLITILTLASSSMAQTPTLLTAQNGALSFPPPPWNIVENFSGYIMRIENQGTGPAIVAQADQDGSAIQAINTGSGDAITADGPTTLNGNLNVNGGNLYVGGGNVGIGTVSPETKLQVNGNITVNSVVTAQDDYGNFAKIFTGNNSSNYSYLRLFTAGAYANFELKASDSVDYPFSLRINDSDDVVEYGKLSIYGAGEDHLNLELSDGDLYVAGNVGIGTTEPGSKLDVAGGANVAGDLRVASRLKFSEATGEDGSYAIIGLDAGSTKNFEFYDYFNSRPMMRLIGSSQNAYFYGNVGIGTTSPVAKLDVTGSVKIHDRLKFSQDGYWADLDIYTDHPSDYPRLYIYETPSGGNRVQTGMYSGGTLSLTGDINADGYVKGENALCIGDDCRDSWPSGGGGGIGGGGVTNYIPKFTASETIGNSVIYQSGSNVGIGTDSPTAELEVWTPGGDGSAIKAKSSGHTIYSETWGTGNDGTDSALWGLAASSISQGDAVLGVLGESRAVPETGSDTSAGIFGWGNINSQGPNGNTGPNPGRTYGVWGETDSKGWTNFPQTIVSGVYGAATNTEDGSNASGVVGRTNNPSSQSFGVYYSGGIGGSGLNSMIIKTSTGPRLTYAQLSPESWVEDFGSGQLQNGSARINLDPLFLETTIVDYSNPIKVFVTLTGADAQNPVRVIKDNTGFTVQELNSGKSNAAFDYRVVAKRKGFEDRRLDFSSIGYQDPYLYPELAE